MMTTAQRSLLSGPLLFGAYGVIRLLDGLDGVRGPGLAWTAGHLCFLVGLVFFAQGFAGMRKAAGSDLWSSAGFWIGGAGVVALAVQFSVDITTGLMADSHTEMAGLTGDFQSVPGVELAFYTVGPLLFFVGQLLLTGRLAALRTLAPWAPVLVLAASLLTFTFKDLIPLGAALLLLSYSPLWRTGVSRAATAPSLRARA
ncbi:hypothetical protein [Streptomyces monomycini]|uniref:hypothetical protein n=1 Tax=Streptomyces monomycini TaxID=371720 RepID=UPI001EE9F2DC|nr:hypothetical protein [Streptomyces monomycini]